VFVLLFTFYFLTEINQQRALVATITTHVCRRLTIQLCEQGTTRRRIRLEKKRRLV
jgi:hypothetical protein